MASDSEGLRQFFILFPPFFYLVENGFRFGRVTTKKRLRRTTVFSEVENGFRFGRVTTTGLLNSYPPFLLKMASDSEGLRPPLFPIQMPASTRNVENGFRFGRVTTVLLESNSPPQPCQVENGFRFGRVTTKTRYPLPITCYVLSEGSNLLIYR